MQDRLVLRVACQKHDCKLGGARRRGAHLLCKLGQVGRRPVGRGTCCIVSAVAAWFSIRVKQVDDDAVPDLVVPRSGWQCLVLPRRARCCARRWAQVNIACHVIGCSGVTTTCQSVIPDASLIERRHKSSAPPRVRETLPHVSERTWLSSGLPRNDQRANVRVASRVVLRSSPPRNLLSATTIRTCAANHAAEYFDSPLDCDPVRRRCPGEDRGGQASCCEGESLGGSGSRCCEDEGGVGCSGSGGSGGRGS
jgi:hypothetical protein